MSSNSVLLSTIYEAQRNYVFLYFLVCRSMCTMGYPNSIDSAKKQSFFFNFYKYAQKIVETAKPFRVRLYAFLVCLYFADLGKVDQFYVNNVNIQNKEQWSTDKLKIKFLP